MRSDSNTPTYICTYLHSAVHMHVENLLATKHTKAHKCRLENVCLVGRHAGLPCILVHTYVCTYLQTNTYLCMYAHAKGIPLSLIYIPTNIYLQTLGFYTEIASSKYPFLPTNLLSHTNVYICAYIYVCTILHKISIVK